MPWVFRDIRAAARDRRRPPDRLSRGGREATRSRRRRGATGPARGGAITYNKTALWLHTLERYLGGERCSAACRYFFERSASSTRSPRTSSPRSTRERSRPDLVFRSGLSLVERIRLRGGRPHVANGGDRAHRGHRAAAGEALFPVDVSGRRLPTARAVREHWDGRDRWKLYTGTGARAAVSAEVDPDNVLLLDIDRTNNSRTLAPQTRQGRTPVDRALVPLAAGPGADLCVLRLSRRAHSGGAGPGCCSRQRRFSASGWRRRSPRCRPRS